MLKFNYFIVFLFLVPVIFAGCKKKDGGCKYNRDCDDGFVCIDKKCVERKPIDTQDGTDTGSTDTGSTDTGSIDTGSIDTGDTDTTDTDTQTDTYTGEDPMPECTRNADCGIGNDCVDVWCDQTTFTCVSQDRADMTPCTNDGLFCTGTNRCILGICTGYDPCQIPEPENSCSQISYTCNEAARTCEQEILEIEPDGTACSETLFCLGNIAKECQNGLCVNPESAANPCPVPTSICSASLCVEASRQCQLSSVNIGETCLENNNACHQGYCTTEGVCNWSDPCVKNPFNNCMDEFCSNPGTTMGDYTCMESFAPDNTSCTRVNDKCFDGSISGVGHCWLSHDLPSCIEPQERSCYDHLNPTLCGPIYNCVSALDPDFCQMVADGTEGPTLVAQEVFCNETVTFSGSDFLSRHYYDYGTNCTGGDYRGMELALYIPASSFNGAPLDVQVAVAAEQEVQLMWLVDLCDSSSCIAASSENIFISGMQSGDFIILEAEPGYPPDTLSVSIICN